MTIYSYPTPFYYVKPCSDDFYCKVDLLSEHTVRVDECIRVCAYNFMGGYKKDEYNSFCLMSYRSLEKDGTVKINDYCAQGYENLLDNFRMYYGAVEDDDTLTIISLGSSLTHRPTKDGYYNQNTMSEGFGVVINKLTNDIVLVTLGEDDGNYWGDHELPYERLSKYDRNEVIRIVNDIDESHFWNKQELIKKLWYYE